MFSIKNVTMDMMTNNVETHGRASLHPKSTIMTPNQQQ